MIKMYKHITIWLNYCIVLAGLIIPPYTWMQQVQPRSIVAFPRRLIAISPSPELKRCTLWKVATCHCKNNLPMKIVYLTYRYLIGLYIWAMLQIYFSIKHRPELHLSWDLIATKHFGTEIFRKVNFLGAKNHSFGET